MTEEIEQCIRFESLPLISFLYCVEEGEEDFGGGVLGAKWLTLYYPGVTSEKPWEQGCPSVSQALTDLTVLALIDALYWDL